MEKASLLLLNDEYAEEDGDQGDPEPAAPRLRPKPVILRLVRRIQRRAGQSRPLAATRGARGSGFLTMDSGRPWPWILRTSRRMTGFGVGSGGAQGSTPGSCKADRGSPTAFVHVPGKPSKACGTDRRPFAACGTDRQPHPSPPQTRHSPTCSENPEASRAIPPVVFPRSFFILLFGPCGAILPRPGPHFANADTRSGGQGWPLAATGGFSLRVTSMTAG